MEQFDFFGQQLFEEAKYYLENAKLESENAAKAEAFMHASLLLGMSALEAYVNSISEELCKSFNLSIYERSLLSEKQINKVLQGEDFMLPKDAKVDIERGNNFINLCKAAKMDVSFITKRYFIKGFNSHAISTSEEQAFKALDNLKYKNYKEDKWKEVKSENDFIKILKEALEA